MRRAIGTCSTAERADALRPELQPELLVARGEAHREHRSVAGGARRAAGSPADRRSTSGLQRAQVVDDRVRAVGNVRRIEPRWRARQSDRRRSTRRAARRCRPDRRESVIVSRSCGSARWAIVRDLREDLADVEHVGQDAHELVRDGKLRIALCSAAAFAPAAACSTASPQSRHERPDGHRSVGRCAKAGARCQSRVRERRRDRGISPVCDTRLTVSRTAHVTAGPAAHTRRLSPAGAQWLCRDMTKAPSGRRMPAVGLGR